LNLASDRRAAPSGDRYPGHLREHPLLVHRAGAERPVCVAVLLHGGGFVSGSPRCIGPAGEQLALRLGGVVVVPAYTLAGDAPFPAAAEDAYAALQWAVRHAADSGWGAPALVVVGYEAGGNLAAAAAMMARDRGGPALAAQVLVRPMLDPSQSSRSMRACCSADALRLRAAYRAYLPGGADAMHPYAAPVASVRLAGLAPALVLTAEGDPLRDEAEAYAAGLSRAGVASQVVRMREAPDAAGWDAQTLDAIAAFVGPRVARPRK
jgi:acetyl esterase/lipase